jgi:hypothetical protein
MHFSPRYSGVSSRKRFPPPLLVMARKTISTNLPRQHEIENYLLNLILLLSHGWKNYETALIPEISL